MWRSIFKRAFDLPGLIAHRRARQYARHDGRGDLELAFYQACFGNDYLHAGYFDPLPADAESISFADLKRAMQAYAELVLNRVPAGAQVLDIGCGTGGFIGQLQARGFSASGLTPSAAHAQHVRERYGCRVIEARFEDADPAQVPRRFDALTSMESFHNVPLDPGVARVHAWLAPGGRWINIDYYRLQARTANRSGRLLADWRAALDAAGLRVIEEVDISAHVAPSMAFAKLIAERVLLPTIDFGVGRFFFKRPGLEWLLADAVAARRARLTLASIDPSVLAREKCYLLQVIEAR